MSMQTRGATVEILEVYCVELEQVITIYDAQKAYFAQPEAKRKRFTFRCSDNDCRRERNPLVAGVNYDKLAEEGDKYRQIHFRAATANPHLDSCNWVQGEAARKVVLDGDAGAPRVERAKKTNVIDIFRPKSVDDTIAKPIPARPAGARAPLDGAAREPQERDRDRAREGYSSTSSLERFINCWSQLEADELKQSEVVIAGKTLSYRQAVSHPEWITPAENGMRILQGGAIARFWPESAPKRLYINFMSDCAKFPEHDGKRTLTIDLPLSRIAAYRGGALLLEKIRQAQSKDHYLRAYCWGTVKARDQRPGYILDIASLDNLVLKAIAQRKKA
jgi:hypothetical protein